MLLSHARQQFDSADLLRVANKRMQSPSKVDIAAMPGQLTFEGDESVEDGVNTNAENIGYDQFDSVSNSYGDWDESTASSSKELLSALSETRLKLEKAKLDKNDDERRRLEELIDELNKHLSGVVRGIKKTKSPQAKKDNDSVRRCISQIIKNLISSDEAHARKLGLHLKEYLKYGSRNIYSGDIKWLTR